MFCFFRGLRITGLFKQIRGAISVSQYSSNRPEVANTIKNVLEKYLFEKTLQ